MLSAHTHYDNLKVARNAPVEVIRAAYRVLAQKHHPDVNPSPDAARVMQLLNEAWEVLSDERRRAAHDAWIAEQERANARPNEAAASQPSKSYSSGGHEYTWTAPEESRRWEAKRRQPSSNASHSPPPASQSEKHTEPLDRLNAWLANLNGRSYALAGVIAVLAASWFLNGTSSYTPSRWSPAPTLATPAVPDATSFDPSTAVIEDLPTLATPTVPKATPEKAEHLGLVPFDGKLDPLPPARRPKPTGGWGAGDEEVLDPLPPARQPRTEYTFEELQSSPLPPARQPKPKPDDPWAVVSEEPVTRWSPSGKPWPSAASYLRGLPQRATGGLSKLTIDNTDGGSNVYVKLCRASSTQCDGLRHVYIPRGSSFSINGIAPGTYDVRYRDLNSGRIAKSEPMALRQIEEEGGTKYSVIRLTLYAVTDGNTTFAPLTEEQF